jgi:hypothetical protein
MKIIGCLLVIAILFSYLPVIPRDDCPDVDPMGSMKLDCGNIFHCPLIFSISTSGPTALPLSGRFFLTSFSVKIEGLPRLVFHPPEYLDQNFDPQGLKEKKEISALA